MSGEVHVGVDVGATWIKAGTVRLDNGGLSGDPELDRTPRPATPKAVIDRVAGLVSRLPTSGPVGVTMPCVVREGHTFTAANIDPEWIELDAAAAFSEALGGRDVVVLNDADAAGLAEAEFGTAGSPGRTVLVLTFGTGIGSALVVDGRLIRHTEFGHLRMPDGQVAERYVGPSVRRGDGFDWPGWCGRVNDYLLEIDTVVGPDLIVIGGGVSVPDDVDQWTDHLRSRAEIVPARMRNYAGVVGAAMAAAGG